MQKVQEVSTRGNAFVKLKNIKKENLKNIKRTPKYEVFSFTVPE